MWKTELQCCAVHELVDISDYSNPRDAMRKLCELVRPDRLEAFYIFTGVVRFKADSDDFGANVTYGPNFAAYIREHKLGIVSGSCIRSNRVNHPDHFVKVWIWAPSVHGLKLWWKANSGVK